MIVWINEHVFSVLLTYFVGFLFQPYQCKFKVWSRPWLNDIQLTHEECSGTELTSPWKTFFLKIYKVILSWHPLKITSNFIEFFCNAKQKSHYESIH